MKLFLLYRPKDDINDEIFYAQTHKINKNKTYFDSTNVYKFHITCTI